MSEAAPKPEKINFEPVIGEFKIDYEKSNQFRVIHVDGATGSVAPAADYLIVSVFSERRPIPQREVLFLTESGTHKEPPKRLVRDADLFREVEATLIMNRSTAEGLKDWLSIQIELMKHAEVARAKIFPAGGSDAAKV